MAELMPVGDNNFSDSEEGEGLEESAEIKGEPHGLENMELRSLELSVVEPQPVFEASGAPEIYSSNKDLSPETPGAEDKGKSSKTKPFRCKPCQYEMGVVFKVIPVLMEQNLSLMQPQSVNTQCY